MNEAVLHALFYPFTGGALEWPESSQRAAFLNACACPHLARLPEDMVCRQHFRPEYEHLERSGKCVVPELEDGCYDVVFLSVPRQVEEMRHDIAQALAHTETGGLVVAAAANDAGGTRLKKLFERTGMTVQVESKHKCRVVWGRKPETVDDALLRDWIGAGSLQPVMNGAFQSRPGLFGWNRIDPGSALLMRHLPATLPGPKGADFGCGYGYLSQTLLRTRAEITSFSCIDADRRAVDACRANCAAHEKTADVGYLWADLAARDRHSALPGGLDWIAMNPPFHSGKTQSTGLGAACIETAAASLRPGGVLYMVSNVHLPYENVLRRHFARAECLHEGDGYKIHAAVR